MECSLCWDECENVSHVLWECSAYNSTEASFMKKLQELLVDDYEDFKLLDNVEKSSYVLDNELWESNFNGLLSLVNPLDAVIEIRNLSACAMLVINCVQADAQRAVCVSRCPLLFHSA